MLSRLPRSGTSFVAFISYKHEDMRWAKWLQKSAGDVRNYWGKSRIKLLGNTRRGCGVKWLRDKEIWKVTGVMHYKKVARWKCNSWSISVFLVVFGGF